MMGAGARGCAHIAGAAVATAMLVLSTAAVAAPMGQSAREASPVSLTNVHLSAVWKQGWLTASIHFSVVVTGETSVNAAVRPVGSGPPAGHADYSLTHAGTFAETIRLPPRLLPREYVLSVVGTTGTSRQPQLNSHFTIPTPPEGVVDIAAISAAKGGKAARALAHPHELWVRFHFLVPPAAKTVKVVWRTPSYTFVGAVTKPYATTITSFVNSGTALPPGKWYAILMVDGKTAKRQEVRVS